MSIAVDNENNIMQEWFHSQLHITIWHKKVPQNYEQRGFSMKPLILVKGKLLKWWNIYSQSARTWSIFSWSWNPGCEITRNKRCIFHILYEARFYFAVSVASCYTLSRIFFFNYNFSLRMIFFHVTFPDLFCEFCQAANLFFRTDIWQTNSSGALATDNPAWFPCQPTIL